MDVLQLGSIAPEPWSHSRKRLGCPHSSPCSFHDKGLIVPMTHWILTIAKHGLVVPGTVSVPPGLFPSVDQISEMLDIS